VTGLALWALLWVCKVFWACALFYFPWRCYAAAETRIRRAYRRRKESVNR
jgi:hypothetical protein